MTIITAIIRRLRAVFLWEKPTVDFNKIRPLFGGKMTQGQVDGINVILRASESLPVPYRAYLLATAFHETARTMQPITEYGGKRYFDKYDTGKLAAALGNTPQADGDGYKYRGRGYVQLTGQRNYRRAGERLGIALLQSPDMALREAVAGKILVLGCCEGWFTEKRLGDYLDGPVPDYRNARRVVNGTDKADLIAGYAATFETALKG